jgi:hypothetical protein
MKNMEEPSAPDPLARLATLEAQADAIEARMVQESKILRELRLAIAELRLKFRSAVVVPAVIPDDAERAPEPLSKAYKTIRSITSLPGGKDSKGIDFQPGTIASLEALIRENFISPEGVTRPTLIALGLLHEHETLSADELRKRSGYKSIVQMMMHSQHWLRLSRWSIERRGKDPDVFSLQVNPSEAFVADDAEIEAMVMAHVRASLLEDGHELADDPSMIIAPKLKKAAVMLIKAIEGKKNELSAEEMAPYLECPAKDIERAGWILGRLIPSDLRKYYGSFYGGSFHFRYDPK